MKSKYRKNFHQFRRICQKVTCFYETLTKTVTVNLFDQNCPLFLATHSFTLNHRKESTTVDVNFLYFSENQFGTEVVHSHQKKISKTIMPEKNEIKLLS